MTLMGALLLPGSAQACTPAFADPWYVYVLTVDEETLPGGIVAATDEVTGSSALQETDGDTVYIVTPLHTREQQPDVPSGYYAWDKFVDGVAYEWVPWKDEWDEHDSRAVVLQPGNIEREGEATQIYQPWRPSFIGIPDSQPFTLSLWQDGELHQSSGTLSYILNPEYDPQNGAFVGDPCEDEGPGVLEKVIGLTFMRIAVMVTAITTWF